MSTETTNKKIKIDNGTTFGKTYTDKAVDERLQGLVSTATFTPVKEKANNSLQKPAGLTKTELVGVGTNGQENIEIGDNLTLANGKLSATGGGGSSDINVLQANDETYSGTIDINKLNVFKGDYFYAPAVAIADHGTFAYFMTFYMQSNNGLNLVFRGGQDGHMADNTYSVQLLIYSHFITMSNSTNNVALYLNIQNTDETAFTAETLATYFAGKKVLANGNLHGAVPTYIAGEGGTIKVYYRTPGDNNINLQPDEFADLSSFAISDLVSAIVPVE